MMNRYHFHNNIINITRLKQIAIFLIVGIIFVLLGIGSNAYQKYLDKKNIFYGRITNIESNLVTINNGTKALLAGIAVPTEGEPNYSVALKSNLQTILLNKQFKFKKILTKNIRYPKYDMVNIYDNNGRCINAEILKSGQAFFDHGYYASKNLYEKLENDAKKQSLGLWKDKDKLQVLFVTSRYWWDFHYPECPEVQKITTNNRVEYYIWPTPIFFYRDPADCKYCRDIEIKFNRPKLFTYDEEDYLEDLRREKEADGRR